MGGSKILSLKQIRELGEILKVRLPKGNYTKQKLLDRLVDVGVITSEDPIEEATRKYKALKTSFENLENQLVELDQKIAFFTENKTKIDQDELKEELAELDQKISLLNQEVQHEDLMREELKQELERVDREILNKTPFKSFEDQKEEDDDEEDFIQRKRVRKPHDDDVELELDIKQLEGKKETILKELEQKKDFSERLTCWNDP
jgi:chromosome segregation ATPase